MLRFRGTEQLDALAGRLRDAPRRLIRELESRLGAAARPAVQDVRREIRGMSMAQRRTWSARSPRRAGGSLGRGSSPLRAPIARAVTLQVQARGDGVSVQVELKSSQVPGRVRWLVPFVLGSKSRLRHPFMGRWRHAVQATGDLNKWWPTLQKHIPAFRQARDETVREIDAYIERG